MRDKLDDIDEDEDVQDDDLELSQMIADKKWQKQLLTAINKLSSKKEPQDNELKPLLQQLLSKLSEPTQPQKELPTPQVNVTNDNKEVAKILSEFKTEISGLKDEMELIKEELQRKKKFDFSWQTSTLGNIISPIKAVEK